MMNQSTTAHNESDRQHTQGSSGHPPPPQPQPTMPYPGYAPQPYPQGYHTQQPYPGYQDPYYQQHHAMPPQNVNGTYYAPTQYPQTYSEPGREYSLARGILCMITMLVIFTTTMSILLWAFYGTNIPRFTVESMSVPTFEIQNSTLNAVWEANLTVYNPNEKMKATFERIEGRVFYKDILIDVAMVDPIWNLNSNEARTMMARFTVPDPGYDSAGAFWYQQIEEDRHKGSIWFSLRFQTVAAFTSGDDWRRRGTLGVICDNLQVQFPNATGGGQWNGSKQDCYIAV